MLTGAVGGIGKIIRHRVAEFAPCVRISDLPGVLTSDAAPHEEVMPCDLADRAAVDRLVEGCNAIVHLGGVSVERPFEEILEANIKGVFNLYEAARLHNVRRIVFASSNHITGFYRQDEKIDAAARKRPDGYYGLSKSFGEDMAQLYFDHYRIETVSIRIGSVFPEPEGPPHDGELDERGRLHGTAAPQSVSTHRTSAIRSCSACRRMCTHGGTTVSSRIWASSRATRPNRSANASKRRPRPTRTTPLRCFRMARS